jgi:hypothetical protein
VLVFLALVCVYSLLSLSLSYVVFRGVTLISVNGSKRLQFLKISCNRDIIDIRKVVALK